MNRNRASSRNVGTQLPCQRRTTLSYAYSGFPNYHVAYPERLEDSPAEKLGSSRC
jgi:hypothetical protein